MVNAQLYWEKKGKKYILIARLTGENSIFFHREAFLPKVTLYAGDW